MLQTIDLECSRGFRTLWRELSFTLEPGELLHVVGENGSGKTSLLRILCGLLEPVAGEVRWKGTATRTLGEDYRRELIYIGHANGVKDDLTAAENLRIACTFCGITPTQPAIDAALRAFGLARSHDAPAKMLSQGQRRRVALARLMLADRHPLWLLDEPFNALDDSAAAHVHTLIGAHLARGGIAVMASHQRLEAQPGRTVRTLELKEPLRNCHREARCAVAAIRQPPRPVDECRETKFPYMTGIPGVASSLSLLAMTSREVLQSLLKSHTGFEATAAECTTP